MLEMLRRPEILAPAGNDVCLRAALDAGCNAVYFGVSGFNMRAAARNFERDDLSGIVAQCHERLVNTYLALNTIIYEQELPLMRETLKAAHAAGVDAVICWDPAVIQACNEIGLEPHLSTQMSIANSQGILFYYRSFGIRRFVMARECSLEDLTSIRRNLIQELGERAAEIEIEAFAHGAMCVSVSGRCFLSEHTFGRSGNRGDCIQPCRREYHIVDVEGETEYRMGTDYVMSPKDICTLPFIEKLIHAGINSLKIEGRNRSPEYVSIVTGAYRRIVDFYFDNYGKQNFDEDFGELKADLLSDLRSVYNRGFSSGFFMGKPVEEWTDHHGSKATRRKEFVGLVQNYYSKIGVAEIKVQSHSFKIGDELMFQGPTTGVVTHKVESIQVEHKPVDIAVQGQSVAIKVGDRVRLNDKVFIWYKTPERAD